MMSTAATNLKLIARAALFTFVAIGGMATGLGLTTYTLAKANDLIIASVSSTSSGNGQAPNCTLK